MKTTKQTPTVERVAICGAKPPPAARRQRCLDVLEDERDLVEGPAARVLVGPVAEAGLVAFAALLAQLVRGAAVLEHATDRAWAASSAGRAQAGGGLLMV